MTKWLYYLDTRIPLEPDRLYTIGRDNSNIICLPGQTISRKHARISFLQQAFILEDLGSTNGTFLNGKRSKSEVLHDGDHITAGTCYLVYKEFDDEKPQEDFDRELSDTLIIENQMAELLESISDRQVHEKLLNLKKSMNRTKEKLHLLANKDRLTGLYNRRYFDEELKKEIERSNRYNYLLSLFMIDIDFFKHVNDEHGHQAGDRALEAMARIISRHTRINDLVARYGGEEIAVLIPEMIPENAIKVAEKIRLKVESESKKEAGLSLTVSIGVSFYRKKSSPEVFVEASDSALYEAKHRGRNRVVIKNPDFMQAGSL